jgi:hypothetical protein
MYILKFELFEPLSMSGAEQMAPGVETSLFNVDKE